MIKKWLRKYFSIVFVFAMLLGSMHHHNDLKQHNDCQICTIQSNLSHADTPVDTLYIQDIILQAQTPITALSNLIASAAQIRLTARAPPQFS
ncbi:hypothetical protein MNB_SM-6-346 [hydrothermal vent metagenome]|uniref:Uncharacterized protein n=1 Tax=hydrothermal vent metagenome TaxID=652676 RepID=A0A1W1BH57_9ZZZZ